MILLMLLAWQLDLAQACLDVLCEPPVAQDEPEIARLKRERRRHPVRAD